MDRRKKYHYIALLFEAVHVPVVLLLGLSIFIILMLPEYRIYAAAYLALVYLIGLIFKDCPLTSGEMIFKRLAREKVGKGTFTQRMIKNLMHVRFSYLVFADKVASAVMFLFFLMSVYIVAAALIF